MRELSLSKPKKKFGLADLTFIIVDFVYLMGIVLKSCLSVVSLMILGNLIINLILFIFSKF